MMKKLLCLLLAMTMLMGCLFVLSACDEKDKDKDKDKDSSTEEKKEEFKLPEGYTTFQNDYVSFAYPSEWSKNDIAGGAGVLIMDGNTGNSITAVGEQYSDIYKTMTVEEFNKLLKPTLEAQGITVSGVKIEQVKASGDLAVTKITYTAKSKVADVKMKQTIYIVPAGDLNYAITVTEAKTVDGLVDTILNSLAVKK